MFAVMYYWYIQDKSSYLEQSRLVIEVTSVKSLPLNKEAYSTVSFGDASTRRIKFTGG